MLTEGITIDYEELSKQLKEIKPKNSTDEILELRKMVAEMQKELMQKQQEIDEFRSLKRKKTKEEKLEEAKKRQERLLAGVDSRGIPLATASGAISSLDEFLAVDEELRNSGRYGARNALLWEIGVATGLRISDLVELTWGHFFTYDGMFREYIPIVEKKTAKQNNILITDYVKNCILTYLNSYVKCSITTVDLTKKVFISQQNNSNENIDSFKDYLSKTIKAASKRCKCKDKISSHGMRKSFVKIIECCYHAKETSENIGVIQMALNHSDTRTTYKYLGWGKDELDLARICVSDFLLGKLGNELNPFLNQTQGMGE